MARAMAWTFDPSRGGTKIAPAVKARTEQCVRACLEQLYKGRYTRVDVRFRGCFGYVDAYREPTVPKKMPKSSLETKAEYLERLRNLPWPLCRLRYRHGDLWSIDLFVYSSEKYETTVFPSGKFFGTIEQAMELAGGFHLTADW